MERKRRKKRSSLTPDQKRILQWVRMAAKVAEGRAEKLYKASKAKRSRKLLYFNEWEWTMGFTTGFRECQEMVERFIALGEEQKKP